jgi:GNAT superfamily N-acetyltransferase
VDVRIVERPATRENLAAYAAVSIAFSAETRLRLQVEAQGLGGFSLREEAVVPAERIDYDQFEPPAGWPDRWNLNGWALIMAYDGEVLVGGAGVAWDSPEISFLGRRKDAAALWDLRVRPEYRRRGVGSALFARAAAWARQCGCALLKIETQNTNVAACRFYVAQGCSLGAIDLHAYPDFPDVVRLIWSLRL